MISRVLLRGRSRTDNCALPSDLRPRGAGKLPGFAPDRRILLVGGVTTQGTQAAVEFLCQPNKLQTLVTEAGVLSDGNILPFECVLEVELKSGVPIESRVAATRSGAEKEMAVAGKAVQ